MTVGAVLHSPLRKPSLAAPSGWPGVIVSISRCILFATITLPLVIASAALSTFIAASICPLNEIVSTQLVTILAMSLLGPLG